MDELLTACVPVIGRALVHFVWQGGVIGLLASIALFALRHAQPQTRYAVACAALLTCLLAPLVHVALQLGAWRAAAAPVFGDAGDGFLIATATASTVGAAAGWTAPLEHWLPTLVAMWAAGATVFCLRMAFGVAWVERLRSTAQPAAQAAWQARLDALASRLGVCAPVALRIVDALPSPAAAGWWRPVVLLPASLLTRMPVEYIEALLAHELAHVRRHDYLVNLLQSLVEALLFFHPVVWWLSRQVRIERELIADGLAAKAIDDPHRLARALAALADLQSTPADAPHLVQAAHGGPLMSRIEHLLRPNRRLAGRVAFPLLGLAAACIAFIAHAQITGDAPKPAAQTVPAPLPPPPVHSMPLPAPLPGASAGVTRMPTPTAPPHVAAHADGDWLPDIDVDLDLDPMPNAAAIAEGAALATATGSARAVALGPASGSDRAYALVRSKGKGATVSGRQVAGARLDTLRQRIGRDFIWFRHDGRAYAVTDPALVARAEAAWRESEAIGREMSALGREMGAHGKRMGEIGRRMGKAGVDVRPSPAMQRAQERLASLTGQQASFAAEQARHAAKQARHAARLAADPGLDEAALEREIEQQVERDMAAVEARVEARMEALEPEIERQTRIIEAEAERIARASAPMDAYEREMEAASEPMEALGERMDELGEHQGRASREADREMRALIRDALGRGLARPVDGTATP